MHPTLTAFLLVKTIHIQGLSQAYLKSRLGYWNQLPPDTFLPCPIMKSVLIGRMRRKMQRTPAPALQSAPRSSSLA
jgi:hypothetical protein